MTADHAGQTGGEREVCDHEWGRCLHCSATFDGRPVPVPGQAAREAAVEAVAQVRALHVEGPYKDCRECSRAWPCPTVAALSAAPGQEQP